VSARKKLPLGNEIGGIAMSKNLTTVMKDIGLTLMSTLEYSYEEIKEEHSKIKETLKAIIGDITELSVDELKELGFKKWEEESELYLIPLWAFDLIPDGTVLESISGERAIKGKDEIDLDVRIGCIAWGFEPK